MSPWFSYSFLKAILNSVLEILNVKHKRGLMTFLKRKQLAWFTLAL